MNPVSVKTPVQQNNKMGAKILYKTYFWIAWKLKANHFSTSDVIVNRSAKNVPNLIGEIKLIDSILVIHEHTFRRQLLWPRETVYPKEFGENLRMA